MNNNRDDKKMRLLLNVGVLGGGVFVIDFVYSDIVEQGAEWPCGEKLEKRSGNYQR